MRNLSVLLCGEEIKAWDKTKPFRDQISSISKIVLNYSIHNHDNINEFLSGLKQSLKISIVPPIKIEVYYDNEVMGARLAKEVKKIEKNIQLSWVTKAVVTNQIVQMGKMSYIDSCLSDMSASLNKVVK